MFEGHPGPDEGGVTGMACARWYFYVCSPYHVAARIPDHGHAGCYIYGRDCSPSVRHLGRQLAALDGTEAGYATASGMSAISCALLSACNTGDHIVASNTLYGRCMFKPLKALRMHTASDVMCSR